MTWLMGSLADRSWKHVILVTPFIVLGCAMLLATARGVDALTLGEAQARSLGVNIGRLYFLAVFGTALAIGASTAVTGVVGFIGLVAPHLVRPLLGHQPSRILLPAALCRSAVAARRRYRHSPDSRRTGVEAWCTDEPDWNAFFLLAGRASEQNGAVNRHRRIRCDRTCSGGEVRETLDTDP